MRNILFIFSFFLAFSFSSLAFSQDQQEEWTEDYGPHPGVGAIEEDYRDTQYMWLYEKIIPEFLRKNYPSEAFKTFRVHLKDSYRVFPDPEKIRSQNLKLVRQIKGSITYVGFFPKSYIYDILADRRGTLVLNVRVHLKNATERDWKNFADKMKKATNIWNQSAPELDFNYRFHFEIVRQKSKAHFSVSVQDSTRGPYDTYWGRDWTPTVVAHEVGHMLGLGDEYQTLTGKFDCYRPSLMCSAWNGSMMEHHYYFVLRRLLKSGL